VITGVIDGRVVADAPTSIRQPAVLIEATGHAASATMTSGDGVAAEPARQSLLVGVEGIYDEREPARLPAHASLD
jgi:hypothetical protein